MLEFYFQQAQEIVEFSLQIQKLAQIISIFISCLKKGSDDDKQQTNKS
jgi:hypothetical protein